MSDASNKRRIMFFMRSVLDWSYEHQTYLLNIKRKLQIFVEQRQIFTFGRSILNKVLQIR